MKKLNGILWGIALIAIGAILALNAFDIIAFDIFFKGWWTLFIIVPCLIALITERDKIGSIIGLCVGVLLLLSCRGILSFAIFWKLIIPIIIVLIGIKIIINSLVPNKTAEFFKEMRVNGGELKSGTATFSDLNMDFSGENFESAAMSATFGAVKCDLRNAIIEKDCFINASAVFGGIDISVPPELNVKVRSNSIFGGVSDKTGRKIQEGKPTLYINATCVFGGIEIK